MRAQLRIRLEHVLSTQSETAFNVSLAENDRRTTVDNELKKFIDLREKLARPVIMDFIEVFKTQSLWCRVSTDEPVQEYIGRTVRSSNITLWLYHNSSINDETTRVPHYSMWWDGVNSTVRFTKSSTTRYRSGEVLSDGAARIHEVTSDLFEEKLMSFAGWILN